MTKGGAKGDDLADEAAVEQLFGLHVGFGQTLVVTDHEELAGFFGGLDHGLTFRQGRGHGFLAQHVLAGL
ncbi:hypothetical protein SDC9_155771 [bioreactor metagenome]|uniref:Uncharacterized protein n=1 Tax=bioreactor metagenome TaxID=1076179 RepID=A0A645F4Y5_9ZZZZ